MRNLVSNMVLPTKKLDFMGQKGAIEIKLLPTSQIREFQRFARDGIKDLPEEDKGLAVQYKVLRLAVVGADEMTDEEFDKFPMKSLSDLIEQIFDYNGLSLKDSAAEGAKGNA